MQLDNQYDVLNAFLLMFLEAQWWHNRLMDFPYYWVYLVSDFFFNKPNKRTKSA